MTSTAIHPAESFGTAPTVDKIVPNATTRVRPGDLTGVGNLVLAIGAIGVIVTLAALTFVDTRQVMLSYLTAYMFTLAIGLGSLFFVLVQHVTRAGWSVGVRRLAENGMANFWLLLLLFVPVAINFETIYHHWVGEGYYAPDSPLFDEVLYGKRGYLNATFFFVRAAVYFAVWIGLARYFWALSRKQDDTGDPGLTIKMAARAAPGLLLFGLSTTFAAFDWIMSINPHWFSTMFGVIYFAGGAMGAIATITLLGLLLNRSGYLKEFVNTEHYHDLGKLLFAFMVFWAYVSFSQYMLIWYANLPEETGWFLARSRNGWDVCGAILFFGHFIVPFVFLMSRHVKRNRLTLAAGAVFLLVMHWFDMQYQIQATDITSWQIHWLDPVALVGVFGLFVGLTIRRIAAHPIVPERDPRLPESVRFQNQ